MSLHLANLSQRIRKDELERIFRRFGRCTLQLKDGYGFAVYDFQGDAEKALRALKGRKICGESVYLSWSNKQPKPLQRFTRASRSLDVRYGRNSARGDTFVGRNYPRPRGDYSTSDKKQLDKGRERHPSADIREDRGKFNPKDAGFEHYDQREVLLEEGGRDEVETNLMDDERWGEQVDKFQNDESDGQMDFDRYEPDYFNERGEEYEMVDSEHLAGSQSLVTLSDKNRRPHPNNQSGRQTCSRCGSVGHKMRDCPLENSLHEKKAYRSDHRHGIKDKSEVGRVESKPGGRLQTCSRNLRSARPSDTDRKPSDSGKDGISSRRPPVENESSRDKRKYHNRKRRREGDDRIVHTHDDKKSRVLPLSHLHSDCKSPELETCSRSPEPLVGLSFRSRSASLVPRSPSASSISNSRPCRSRSRSFKTKSRSRSRSPSSSLSISVGGSLPSSPKKAEINLNGFSGVSPSPLSKDVLTEVRQQSEPEVIEENLSITNSADHNLSGSTDKATTYRVIEVPGERKQSEHDSEKLISAMHTEVSLNGFVIDDQIPQYEEAVLENRQRLEPEIMQNFKPPLTDMLLQSEDGSSGKVIGSMKVDELLIGGGSDSTFPHASREVEAPCSSLMKDNAEKCFAVRMAGGELRETEELTDPNALEMTKHFEPANNMDLKAQCKFYAGSHLSISAEELSNVLKHYGLKPPEENEQRRDVGDYFGSSRLWPWEMIYYRRLKKGPISVENYARRVAQNEAFNITDKYIRSSSGWGELIEELQ